MELHKQVNEYVFKITTDPLLVGWPNDAYIPESSIYVKMCTKITNFQKFIVIIICEMFVCIIDVSLSIYRIIF